MAHKKGNKMTKSGKSLPPKFMESRGLPPSKCRPKNDQSSVRRGLPTITYRACLHTVGQKNEKIHAKKICEIKLMHIQID